MAVQALDMEWLHRLKVLEVEQLQCLGNSEMDWASNDKMKNSLQYLIRPIETSRAICIATRAMLTQFMITKNLIDI